jgi:hypothetical protein
MESAALLCDGDRAIARARARGTTAAQTTRWHAELVKRHRAPATTSPPIGFTLRCGAAFARRDSDATTLPRTL